MDGEGNRTRISLPGRETAQRLVVFGDSNSFPSRWLVKSALEVARAKSVRVTLLCDTGFPRRFGELVHDLQVMIAWRVWRIFEADTAPRLPFSVPRFTDLARRFGVPILRAPGSSINRPFSLEKIRNAGADWSLCFLSLAIFGPELLGLLKRSVNYHNGSLPRYRGLRATGWSLYQREARTGYAFHYMARSIDSGPVLIQDSLPVHDGATPRRLDLDKAVHAAKRLPEVFDLLAAGNPGERQGEGRRYYDRAAFERITSVDRPSELTAEELYRRLRAFEDLKMTLNGTIHTVTRLRRVDEESSTPLDFDTADGVRLRPSRFMHMPRVVHRFYRMLKGGGR